MATSAPNKVKYNSRHDCLSKQLSGSGAKVGQSQMIDDPTFV
jgi:hypothetical protein